jgi:hypothetical protein
LIVSGRPIQVWIFTANTQYRKFETNIPRKVTARPQSQFLHSCFCERFRYSHDRSAYSAAGNKGDRAWEYIDRSQTHEYGNWDKGRAITFLVIHKSKFLCSAHYEYEPVWWRILMARQLVCHPPPEGVERTQYAFTGYLNAKKCLKRQSDEIKIAFLFQYCSVSSQIIYCLFFKQLTF